MIFGMTKEMIRRDRASAKFLACLKKIHRIDEKMKTASGERLQKLADQKAILELEMDQLWTVGMGHHIEYRGEE